MTPMDITFKCRRFTTTLYLAPTISCEGMIAIWKGRHGGWKKGFVVRFLWLGFLLRWGKKHRSNTRCSARLSGRFNKPTTGIMNCIVDRLREIAVAILKEHGVLPPYTLVVSDGEGNSVSLDFTVEFQHGLGQAER